MKKFIFMGIIGSLPLGSCNNKSGEGHNHETEERAHTGYDREDRDHESKNHNYRHEGAGHEHGHTAKAAAGHSDEIILSPVKAQTAGMETSIIEPDTFSQMIKISGRVMATQDDESVIVAIMAGVVSFHGKVIGGMSISKGTPLVMLLFKNMADGDPVQGTRIAYETARKRYERMKGLFPNKIVSEKDFAQARQTYENARISYEAVTQDHSAQGQAILSPISGYIKSPLMKKGDYVTVGQPLVNVTQNRKLFLRADVSEKYYPYLRITDPANFRTPHNNKVYILKELNGRLLPYGKTSGGNSYYVPITPEFDNKGDIISGSFVKILLLSSPTENIIPLLHAALTEEQGSFFVYLQIDEEEYKKQPVTLGADNGEKVQILSSVKAGGKVVTQGVYQVKLAGAVNTVPTHSREH